MDKCISGLKKKKAVELEDVPLWNDRMNRWVIDFSKSHPKKMNWENDVKLAIFFKFVW